MLEGLRFDVRLAWRGLRRAKWFSAAAMLTMALGIGATTTMFALVEGVLLRPLPVVEQDRLIVAWKELNSSRALHHPFGGAEIEAVRASARLLDGVAGVWNNAGREIITEAGVSTYVSTAAITGDFFQVLGARAILGRATGPADDLEGAEPVLAISYRAWTRRYARAPDVLGRKVTLGEKRFTIVGVMPPGLDYPVGVEMWRTTRTFATNGPFGDAARQEIDLVARRRPGVTIEQAAGELTALTRQLESQLRRDVTRGLVPIVRPFVDAAVGGVRITLLVSMGAVGLLLLIASANVANLLLMRGESRRGELAVREALGAGRARIVRQLLAESALLTLVAAGASLVASWWSLHLLLAVLPDGMPRVEAIGINAKAVIFAAVVALLTALLAGVMPAFSVVRHDLVSQLRGGSRGVTGGGSRRARRTLVVIQVGLAVTVVAAAGLLARSVLRLQSADTGMAVDRLVLVELSLPDARYPDRVRHGRFLDQAMARLDGAPAIASVTPVNLQPFSGEGWEVPKFTAERQSADRAAANPSLHLESVYPNYFDTLGVPVRRGRAFTAGDREGALPAAILSEDAAAATWPGEDAVGKRIKLGGPESRGPWLTIVGIAEPTRYRDVARPRPTMYLPAAQFLITAEMLVVRTTVPANVLAPTVRELIRSVDSEVLVTGVTPFSRMLDRPLARPRFNAFLLGVFGVAALLLSAIGLYAVLAAFVRQRDRELALRAALGATAARLCRVVLGEAIWLAGLGTAIGLAGAAVSTRLVRGMLFEVHPLDPAALAGAAASIVAAAALASYLPMRKATRADAISLLRN